VSVAYAAAALDATQLLREALLLHETAYAAAAREPLERFAAERERVDRWYGDRHQPVDRAYQVILEEAQTVLDEALAPLEARRRALDIEARETYDLALREAQAAWDDALLAQSEVTVGLRRRVPPTSPRRVPPRARSNAGHVLVPFVPGMLRPQTKAEVIRQRPAAMFVPTPREDDTSYARVLIEASRLPGHLVVVEQDVVPPPGAIRQLLQCVHPWCYHLLALDGRLTPACLGLAKFDAGLKVRFGDWMAEAVKGTGETDRGSFAVSCDVGIARWMERQGVPAHVHEPPPVHLHWKGYHGW